MTANAFKPAAASKPQTEGAGSVNNLPALLAQLPDALHVCRTTVLPQVAICQITDDSREVRPNTLFVAVGGLQTDGHRYIPQALASGAAAVVGSYPLSYLKENGWWPQQTDTPFIQVEDSREALAWLSAALNGFPSRAQTVVGVTGTDGKTTTCSLLEAILSSTSRVGVITTVGARIASIEQETGLHVTTPVAPAVQALLAQMRSAECRYAIIESTSFGLDQKRVAAVEYDVAALTNITHEHLDIHGSFEAYREAKFLLFRSLFRSKPKPGVPRIAVFNLDDNSCPHLQNALAEERAGFESPIVSSYTYSAANASADVYACKIQFMPDATRFELVWWGGAFPVETRLIGEFNVSNILCASAVALGLGIPPEQIRQGVASLTSVLGRMQRMDCGQDFLAVVDFAHSPASLERALETLRPLVAEDTGSGPGRLIAIYGCAGLRDRGKRRLMGQISGRLADFTVITAEDPRTEDLAEINREIAAGIADVFPSQTPAALGGPDLQYDGTEPSQDTDNSLTSCYAVIPDRAEAIRYGAAMARSGDVVASFGKGHERSMCFGETEYPWNEQDAMLAALRACTENPS